MIAYAQRALYLLFYQGMHTTQFLRLTRTDILEETRFQQAHRILKLLFGDLNRLLPNGLLDGLTFTLQTLRAHHEASGARVAILTSYRANTRIFNLQLILPDILSVSSWINGRWSILLTDRELT